MPAPNITTLPTAPSRSRPSTFSTEADAFLGALPDFGDEANALGDYLDTLAATVDTDATAAATSASNAATSETNAATSATNAATSETNAATSATSAAASATAAAASYDSFDDRYLGPKASAPSTDNDGDPLVEGAIYWNSTENKLYIWTGSAWDQAALNVNETNALINTNNLSDLASAATARINLGVEIGVDVQAYDANLPTWPASVDATEVGYLDGVTSAIQTQLDAKMTPTYTGDVNITGELIADSYNESYNAVTSTSNATTVDCETGNAFSHTLTENTTFTFSNPPASGTAFAFSLEIIQDASASGFTVTWPTSVDWPSATAPTLTATASAKDVFVFYTRDGGTNWYGFTAGQALG